MTGRWLGLAMAAIILVPSRAGACLVEQISLADAPRSAEAFFVGRVLEISDHLERASGQGPNVRRVVFEVAAVWKGPHRPSAVVWADIVCGSPFVKGELFLVFAGRPYGYFETSISWPNRRITKDSPVPPSLGRPSWTNVQFKRS